MTRNIKETFRPKIEMQKMQVLQDSEYVRYVDAAEACMHAMLQGPMSYPISMLIQLIQMKRYIIH